MMSRFIKIGADGAHLAQDAADWIAVLDTKHGLMFTAAESEEITHGQAVEYAAALTVGGFKDWRLPTVEELFLLADRTRSQPAIDTEYFPACKSDWYWTSTPYAPSPGVYAWSVYFNGGGSYASNLDNVGFVRAVRVGQ
jgi:Protein of unknown function (DUF1566)